MDRCFVIAYRLVELPLPGEQKPEAVGNVGIGRIELEGLGIIAGGLFGFSLRRRDDTEVEVGVAIGRVDLERLEIVVYRLDDLSLADKLVGEIDERLGDVRGGLPRRLAQLDGQLVFTEFLEQRGKASGCVIIFGSDLQTYLVNVGRLLKFAPAGERHGQVEMGRGEPRIEFDCASVIPDGLAPFALVFKQQRELVVDTRAVRIELQRGYVVLQRFPRVPLHVEGARPVVVRIAVRGVRLEDFGEPGDGVIELFLVEQGDAQVQASDGQQEVLLDRDPVMLDGRIELALVVQCAPKVVVGQREMRVQLNRAPVMTDRPVEFALVVQFEGKVGVVARGVTAGLDGLAEFLEG